MRGVGASVAVKWFMKENGRDVAMETIPSSELASDAVRLSLASDHPVYDCAYLACAASLAAPLITADHVFAAKAVKVNADHLVHLLGSP